MLAARLPVSLGGSCISQLSARSWHTQFCVTCSRCPSSRLVPQPIHPLPAIRLYDVLFKSEDPGTLDTWLEDLNPDSLLKLQGCVMTPALAGAKVGAGAGAKGWGHA